MKRPTWRCALLAYAACVLVAYVIAAVCQTAFVLSGLMDAGATIPFAVMLDAVGHDLYGLAFNPIAVSYLAIIALGFLLALPVAAWLDQHGAVLPGWVLFVLAGIAAMAAQLEATQFALRGQIFYSGTRTLGGYISQLAAGGIGGAVFGWVRSACR